METTTHSQIQQMNENLHYHLTDGKELTICTPNDAKVEFPAWIRQTAGETIEPEITTWNEHLTQVTRVEGKDGKRVDYRSTPCTDPTCAIALSDYWL